MKLKLQLDDASTLSMAGAIASRLTGPADLLTTVHHYDRIMICANSVHPYSSYHSFLPFRLGRRENMSRGKMIAPHYPCHCPYPLGRLTPRMYGALYVVSKDASFEWSTMCLGPMACRNPVTSLGVLVFGSPKSPEDLLPASEYERSVLN